MSYEPAKQTQELLDSLTKEQRKGIAQIIRSADVSGNWLAGDDGSVWEQSVEDTLDNLAFLFEEHDPDSVI